MDMVAVLKSVGSINDSGDGDKCDENYWRLGYLSIRQLDERNRMYD